MFGNWRGMWFNARRAMHHGPFAMIAKAGVELTDDQVEKLAEIKGDGLMNFAEQGAGMMPHVRDIIRALSKSEIDKDKVRQIHKDLQEKRNKMGDQFVENIIAIAEVLTAEQRKQIRMHMLRASLGLLKHEHGPHEHGPGDEHWHEGPPPPPPHRHR